MTDKANTLAAIKALIGDATKALTKRQISRLKPLLEDLLEAYVLEASEGPKNEDLGFEGRVNINLLNLGQSDLFLQDADFDLNAVTGFLTVTGVWVFSPGKQAIIVDILFGAPE